jgi:outer membrane protein assembly factor BamB
VVIGTHVAVADLQGYVHFLDATTGALAARMSSSGDRVSMPMVSSGDMVVVIDDAGHLTAFRILPPKG